MSECCCSVKIQNLNVIKSGQIILSGIDLAANHGEILAIIGRNGSGKTTLLNAILHAADHKNKIQFFDSFGERILNPKIGYVPQKLNFDRGNPLTVLNLFCTNSTNFPIWFGASKSRTSQVFKLLKKIGVENSINKPLGLLSGGELQRVLLAFALDPHPDILLLDEPISAVDSKGIEVFYKILISMRNEFHMPIILVSHDLAQMKKYATKYALIEQRILEIGNAQNLSKSSKIKEIFGFD